MTDNEIKPNPANQSEARTGVSPARRRIPMSVPRQKLSVPEMSGYHLYWALESRLPQFLQAGYEFVDAKEIVVNNFNVANPNDSQGNSSLDSRVRVVAGRSEAGDTEYHVLMKLRQEWWDEDRRLLEDRNAQVLGTIFRGEQILGPENVSPEDKRQRYVDPDRTSLLVSEPKRGLQPLLKRKPRKV